MNLKLSYLNRKWAIARQLAPFLAVVMAAKLTTHYMKWEFLSLNPLFTSLVAATTFLLGFLITGVLADYKESEKIPGDMAASLEAISDEAGIVLKKKNSSEAGRLLEHVSGLTANIINWFHRREKTGSLLKKIKDMNEHFGEIEHLIQATFLTRMKQEQNNLRKAVTRAHAIRETGFALPAYAIVEALAFFLIMGMLILKLEPFFESIFFVLLVSFVVLYMIFLIKDLDNPFDYEHDGGANEISLKPLHDILNKADNK